MERQRAFAEVFREVLRGFQQSLLHDVISLDTRSQATVEPGRGHPGQPVVETH